MRIAIWNIKSTCIREIITETGAPALRERPGWAGASGGERLLHLGCREPVALLLPSSLLGGRLEDERIVRPQTTGDTLLNV